MMSKSLKPSPVEGLRFDTISDILRSLRVATSDDMMLDLEGGRGLKFTTYLDSWTDFATLADYLVDLSAQTYYRAEWAWVDHVVPVTLRSEVDRLLNRLFHLIQIAATTMITLIDLFRLVTMQIPRPSGTWA
jgi:uncharacterized protein (TIGR04141 family)